VIASEMTVLFKKARNILQTEGLKALIGRGFKRGFYEHQIYYLYEHSLKDRDEANYQPRIKDFIYMIISTRQEADKLIFNGFDFHPGVTNIRQRLDKGAVAFCVFMEKDLASIGFIAMTQKAMDGLNQPPYKVNFSTGEACTGGGWTNPNYRASGLATYVYFKRLQALKERGKVIARAAVTQDNTVSHKMHARFTPKIIYALTLLFYLTVPSSYVLFSPFFLSYTANKAL
jgi:hypothetical protein